MRPDDTVKRLIEKPSDKRNNLVVVGFYYFKQSELLIEAIREQIDRDIRTQNEYFLADAINLMLERGLRMGVQRVEVWRDCGRPRPCWRPIATCWPTGHDNRAQVPCQGFVIIPPVNIHPTAQITSSVIGPYATVAANCRVDNSIIRDYSWTRTVVQDALLSGSLIGRSAKVVGRFRAYNVGEASEVGFE